MATIQCVNRKASPAYKGQAIICTLNGADSLTQIPQLAVGQQCVIDSSGALGTIAFVDTYGHTFKVSPNKPEQWLGTGTSPESAKNTFDVSGTITVTL